MSSEEYFIRGKGSYVDDINLPRTMHMAVVRSPYARASIRSVKGGITASEVGAIIAAVGEGAAARSSSGPWGNMVPLPALASGYAAYEGQPIAAVVGEGKYEAEDLVESVELDLEAVTPVMDPLVSEKSPRIHPATSSNVLSSFSVGQQFEPLENRVALEDTLSNARLSPNPMETRGALANFESGKLTLWASTQSVHSLKSGLVRSLNLPPESVRVIQADTGGGFGSKGGLYPEHVLVSYCAIKYKRPVKWVESRSEHLRSTNQGRGAFGRIKIWAARDGRVDAISADVLVDAGAYFAGLNAFSPRFIAFQLTGPYSIGRAFVTGKAVYTNKVPLGPYRGAGRPEASFFVERMMDMLADELKLDPAEVRLRNTSVESFSSPLGLQIEASRPFFETAVQRLGYRREITEPGTGLSFFVLVPAAEPGEGVRISVRGGRVSVWLGTVPHGQGHETFVKELVAKELGVDQSLVALERADTDNLAQGVGTWGSRSALVGGAALVDACRKLKAKATETVGATVGKVEYSPSNLLSGEFDVESFFQNTGQVNSFGAVLARAAVEEDRVRVTRCSGCYDVGRALNPEMIVSQAAGGAAQGIGQTLYESLTWDENGSLLTANLIDAGLPMANELPRFEAEIVENPSKMPHGARGMGESPTIGVPSALVRAIETLMRKRIRATPICPLVPNTNPSA